jgi:hypothetical protein
LEGYEFEGKPTPFATVQKLGAAIKKFQQLTPAIEGFTQAITEFFAPDEEAETTTTGE